MRKISVLIFLSFVSVYCFAVKKRVLFIGNSYTYVNNLPDLVAAVAASQNDTVIYDSNTPGGYTLHQHTTNTATLSKIMAGNWDYVVLQEQSQNPSFPDVQVANDVYPYARQLDSLIKVYNPCAETIFYMTWGRKNGDAANCPYFPPLCTYEGMDSLLRLRYTIMADSNDALLSPVGAVWHYLRHNSPTIDLYSADESHPSVAGSYAAACSFYATIFRKDPTTITFNSTLNATTAATIRTAAKTVVFDSLSYWNVGKYDPIANFNYNNVGNAYTFSNLSQNATQFYWMFGDGDTSTLAAPQHTYTSSGNYTVKLIASKCGMTDTLATNITVSVTSIDFFTERKLVLYPNPVKETAIVELNNTTVESCIVSTVLGKKTAVKYTIKNHQLQIDCSGLAKGIYILNIVTNKGSFSEKMVKE